MASTASEAHAPSAPSTSFLPDGFPSSHDLTTEPISSPTHSPSSTLQPWSSSHDCVMQDAQEPTLEKAILSDQGRSADRARPPTPDNADTPRPSSPETPRKTSKVPHAPSSSSHSDTPKAKTVGRRNCAPAMVVSIDSPSSPSKRRRSLFRSSSSSSPTRLPACGDDRLKLAVSPSTGSVLLESHQRPARRRTRTESGSNVGRQSTSSPQLGEAMDALKVTSDLSPPLVDAACSLWTARRPTGLPSPHREQGPSPTISAVSHWPVSTVGQRYDVILAQPCSPKPKSKIRDWQQPLYAHQQITVPAPTAVVGLSQNVRSPMAKASFVSSPPVSIQGLDLRHLPRPSQQPPSLAPAFDQDATITKKQVHSQSPREARSASTVERLPQQMQHQPLFKIPSLRPRRNSSARHQQRVMEATAVPPSHEQLQVSTKHRRQASTNLLATTPKRVAGLRLFGLALSPASTSPDSSSERSPTNIATPPMALSPASTPKSLPSIVVTPPASLTHVSRMEPNIFTSVDEPQLKLPTDDGDSDEIMDDSTSSLSSTPHSTLPSPSPIVRPGLFSSLSANKRECTPPHPMSIAFRSAQDAAGVTFFMAEADSILSETLRLTQLNQSYDIARRLLRFVEVLMDPSPNFALRVGLTRSRQGAKARLPCEIPSLSFQTTVGHGGAQVLVSPGWARQQLLSMLHLVMDHIVTGIAALLGDDRAPYEAPSSLARLCQVFRRDLRMPLAAHSRSLSRLHVDMLRGQSLFVHVDSSSPIDHFAYLETLRDIDPSAIFIQHLEENLTNALERGDTVRSRANHLVVPPPRRGSRKKWAALNADLGVLRAQRDLDMKLASSGQISEQELRSRERKRAALGCPKDVFAVLNYVRFVGELYKVEIVPVETVQAWLMRLLFDTVFPGVPSLYELEAGCALLITVGEALEREAHLDMFPQIIAWRSTKNTNRQPSRVRQASAPVSSSKERSDQAPEDHWIRMSPQQVRQEGSPFQRCRRQQANDDMCEARDCERRTMSSKSRDDESPRRRRSDSAGSNESSSCPSATASSSSSTSSTKTTSLIVIATGLIEPTEEMKHSRCLQRAKIADEEDREELPQQQAAHVKIAKETLDATMRRLMEIVEIEEIDEDARDWCREVLAMRARGWKTDNIAAAAKRTSEEEADEEKPGAASTTTTAAAKSIVPQPDLRAKMMAYAPEDERAYHQKIMLQQQQQHARLAVLAAQRRP